MSDIVERLRKGIEWTGPTQDDTGQTENYMDEAADLITALRADNERLRAALWDVHALANNGPLVWSKRIKATARAALEGK